MIAIVGLVLIEPLGLYSWYAQTYIDLSGASLQRRISIFPQALGKGRTLAKPLVSLLFILGRARILDKNEDSINLDEERSNQPR